MSGEPLPTAAAVRDRQVWARLLERSTPGPALVDRLVELADAPSAPGSGDRDWRWQSLLGSAVPLSTDHLTALAAGSLPPSLAAARALLGHRALTVATVTALLGPLGAAVPGTPGGPPTAGWIFTALHHDPRAWVHVPTRIRSAGLGHWHPRPGERLSTAQAAAAQARFAAAMADIDAFGEAGWRVAAELVPNAAMQGPAYVTAVRGVLAEPAGC